MVRVYLVEGDEAELQNQLPIIRQQAGRGNMVAHFPGGGLNVAEGLRAINPDLVVYHEYNDQGIPRVSYFNWTGVLKAAMFAFACVTVIAVFQIVAAAVVTIAFIWGFCQVVAIITKKSSELEE